MDYINTKTQEVFHSTDEMRKSILPDLLPSRLTREALKNKNIDYLYDLGLPKYGMFQEVIQDGVLYNSEKDIWHINYSVVDKTLTTEEKTTIMEEQLKIAKEKQIIILNNMLESKIQEVLGTICDTEIKSWDKQENEARAFKLDANTPTPYIDALLIARNLGETKLELVDKILIKADLFAVTHASVLGNYHNKVKEIENTVISIETADSVIDSINEIIL